MAADELGENAFDKLLKAIAFTLAVFVPLGFWKLIELAAVAIHVIAEKVN